MEAAAVTVKRRQRHGPPSWRALFRRFEASSLGVEEFCRCEDISKSRFNRWRRVLGVGQLEPAAVPTDTPAEFIELDAVPSPTVSSAVSRLELRLDIGAGVVLHLVRG